MREWIKDQQVPFAYKDHTWDHTWVGYDDPESLKIKVHYKMNIMSITIHAIWDLFITNSDQKETLRKKRIQNSYTPRHVELSHGM